MNRTRISAAVMALLACLSCTRHESMDGTGYLAVTLDTDRSENLVVKSDPDSGSEDIYSLTISSKSDGETIEVEDVSVLETTPQELKVGAYTLTATNHKNPDVAAWETPVYAGSSSVTIRPDRINTANLTVTLANTKVTVEFDKSVTEKFVDYSLSMNNGLGKNLVFGKAETEAGKAGYFSVTGKLNWEVFMVNAEGQTYTSGIQVYEEVGAKQHYHLTIRIEDKDEPFGGTAFKIVVNDSYTEKTYNMAVDYDDNTPSPVISADVNLNDSYKVAQYSGLGWNIKLDAPAGLRQVLFNHNDANLEAAGFPMWNYLYYNSPQSAGVATTDFGSFKFGFELNAEETAATLNIDNMVENLNIGTYEFYITLVDSKNKFTEQTLALEVVSSKEVTTLRAVPWAKFAILRGKWNTETRPDGLSFKYKKAKDSDWMDCTGNLVVDQATGQFSMEIYGLDPVTDYMFMAVSAKDQETPASNFSTEAAGTVPNLSFDDWYQSGKAWYPDIQGGEIVWDSANPGTSGMGVVSTVPEESILAVSGAGKKAAKLSSSTAMGVFAAGNIYTGHFVKVSGLGAELNWGYGFNSRPLALKGYLRYDPVKIDKVKDPFASLKGEMDMGSIKMYLADWSSMFVVNTNKQLFLQDDDPGIIAMGGIEFESTNGQYISFTIPLKYNSTTRIPTFIVITGAASRYGDYFTGGVGSTLYLDEFSLVYDPAELTEQERAEVNYR